MKKIYTIIAALAIATGATAQSFTVHTKDGKTVKYHCSDVDSISFDNEKEPEVVAPRIGDIYYSDGTWSTNLKEGATPIGIVFRVGIASDMSDREAFYTKKDGTTPFDEFHGYVVALRGGALSTQSLRVPVPQRTQLTSSATPTHSQSSRLPSATREN